MLSVEAACEQITGSDLSDERSTFTLQQCVSGHAINYAESNQLSTATFAGDPRCEPQTRARVQVIVPRAGQWCVRQASSISATLPVRILGSHGWSSSSVAGGGSSGLAPDVDH